MKQAAGCLQKAWLEPYFSEPEFGSWRYFGITIRTLKDRIYKGRNSKGYMTMIIPMVKCCKIRVKEQFETSQPMILNLNNDFDRKFKTRSEFL